MFSAFKKLTGRSGSVDGTSSGATPPPGLTTMSLSLQKKFAKGVHYNMKIIVKGDRNVGKSQLYRRLQGQPFLEEYTATEEIQVANITWNYKTSDDIVKVEIWDIVDVANRKKKLPSDKLKLENTGGGGKEVNNGGGGGDNPNNGGHEIALDANTIDVYKKTNGVIFVFDITKAWTFDYVKREINNVPDHIPILIMGNRVDMGHHRAVAFDTVSYFIEGLERTSKEEIRYAESSMRNGFGLKFIHKFFNLPYLHLQREALVKQIDVNREQTEITIQELDYYAESDEANYDLFIDGLTQKRRLVADALSPPKLSLAEAQAVASAKALKDTKSSEAAAVTARLAVQSDPTTNRPIDPKSLKGNLPTSMTSEVNSASSRNKDGLEKIRNVGAYPELNLENGAKGATTTSLKSNGQRSILSSANNSSHFNSMGGKKTSGVEDFVPDDDFHKISSFLDDGTQSSSTTGSLQQNRNNALHLEDSSDEDGGNPTGGGGRMGRNPMVAAVEEDIDEHDLNIVKSPYTPKFLGDLSSDDEKEDDDKNATKEQDGFTGPNLSNAFSSKRGPSGKIGFDVFLTDEATNETKSAVDSDKKSSKKVHKKSKHHKKKKDHLKHHTPDLEEFLSGEPNPASLETDAYEAL